MIFTKDFSIASLKRLRILAGALIFLAIILPWWVAITIATEGAWPKGFIWTHNVERYITTMEGHGGFPGVAIILFIISLFPLSVYLPGAVKGSWKNRGTNELSFFSLVASAVVLIFFSFSKTMLPNYIAPAVPFGAIMLGYFIDRKIANPLFVSGSMKIGAIIALIIALAVPFILNDYILKYAWLSDLTELRWIFLPVSIGAALAVYFVYKNRWKESLLSYLFSFWVLALLTFYWAAPAILSKNPVTESIPLIQQANREIVAYGNFNPAYVFSLEKPLLTFSSMDQLMAYVKNKSVVLISRKEYEVELVAMGFRPIFEKPYLFEYPVVLVMTYQP